MSAGHLRAQQVSANIRLALGCVALLGLGACASGATTGAMTVPLSPDQIIADNSSVKGAIAIGTVSGGDETNPLWKSEVSNANFKTALENSFALATLKAKDKPLYTLNAKLVSLQQPFAGFDMTVTSTVQYALLPTGKSDPVMNDTVATPYTAKFGDALVGVERLRLANEGAMRENIKEEMSRILTAAKPGGPLSNTPGQKVSSAQ